MNSACPSCETILRNPRFCACGWRLNADAPLEINTRSMSKSQLEHNRFKAKQFVQFAHSLNKPYEPGENE
jgi:hypothetical protein